MNMLWAVVLIILAIVLICWYRKEKFSSIQLGSGDTFIVPSATQSNLYFLFSSLSNGVTTPIPTQFTTGQAFKISSANAQALYASKSGTPSTVSATPGVVTMGANQAFIIMSPTLGPSNALIAVFDSVTASITLPAEAANGTMQLIDYNTWITVIQNPNPTPVAPLTSVTTPLITQVADPPLQVPVTTLTQPTDYLMQTRTALVPTTMSTVSERPVPSSSMMTRMLSPLASAVGGLGAGVSHAARAVTTGQAGQQVSKAARTVTTGVAGQTVSGAVKSMKG
jgi:hypothetical protein